MGAKPWSTSSVSNVASNYTDLRISGDVKQLIVTLLVQKLDNYMIHLEEETLAKDPGRKTLGDPSRERLGFSRTRGLMLEKINHVDSVGAAAVVRMNEDLEKYLETIISAASKIASIERVGTIKTRHIEKYLNLNINVNGDEEPSSTTEENDSLDHTVSNISTGVMTPASLRQLSRSLAKMPVSDDCLDELLLLYADYAAIQEEALHGALMGSNPHKFHEAMNRLESLRQLGFLRRMLQQAGERAREEGSRKVEVSHVINIDPYE